MRKEVRTLSGPHISMSSGWPAFLREWKGDAPRRRDVAATDELDDVTPPQHGRPLALGPAHRSIRPCARAPRQLPVRPRIVARVAAGITQQVILMLRLGLPERTGRPHLGNDGVRPKAGGVHVGDGVLGDSALLVRQVVDAG